MPQSTQASQPALQWVRILRVVPGRTLRRMRSRPKAADSLALGDVVIADRRGLTVGGFDALPLRQFRQGGKHALECPGQVVSGRTRGAQAVRRGLERAVGCIMPQRQGHAVGRSGTDQWRAANHHGADGVGCVVKRFQIDVLQMRTAGEIDR